MASALAAACLRHQRAVFFSAAAAGAGFSFATGRSALDVLHTTDGAPLASAGVRRSRVRRLLPPQRRGKLPRRARWRARRAGTAAHRGNNASRVSSFRPRPDARSPRPRAPQPAKGAPPQPTPPPRRCATASGSSTLLLSAEELLLSAPAPVACAAAAARGSCSSLVSRAHPVRRVLPPAHADVLAHGRDCTPPSTPHSRARCLYCYSTGAAPPAR